MTCFWKRLLLWLTFNISIQAIPITGATWDQYANSGELPLRYEINDFENSGPAFDLYVLALQRLQAQNQTDLLSYYQIAGIHGYPAIPWDGVHGDGPQTGYCLHNSVLFPTWHRPYLALLEEQTMWAYAQELVYQYPADQQDRYQIAAESLRIPYWDWLTHPELPHSATTSTLLINTPTGLQNVTNPLYRFEFHSGSQGHNVPVRSLANLPWTTRYYDPNSGQGNDSKASERLTAGAANRMSLIYQLLSSVENYTQMSTTAVRGGINLESVHNDIHNLVGGNGHMTYIDSSAFDPVFWLHHANVDRILALWQALHPQSYVEPLINNVGSFYELAGTVDAVDTGLAPFHSDNNSTFHTSETVRDTSAFGYTYADLGPWRMDESDRVIYIRQRVNMLYAANMNVSSSRRELLITRSMSKAAFRRVSLDEFRDLSVNNANIQWSVALSVAANALQAPCVIDFFLASVLPAEGQAITDSLIGSFSPLLSGSQGATQHQQVWGQVSLTHSLLAGVHRGFLRDLSSESVIPVLKHFLKWRVRTVDDEAISINEISGLTMLVQSQHIKPRRCDEEFPIYGEYQTHFQLTQG